MNATPRPWIIGKNAADYKGRVTIRDAEGWEIAQIPGLPSDQPHERQDANAELIIRAVNSYDAMREALEAIYNASGDEQHIEAYAKVRAALALTKGGQS